MSERIDRYERTNRSFWDDDADDYQAAHHDDISDAAWGAYRIPESDLQVLGDLAGLDVLELGCGGAQASLALAGAARRSFGLDLSIGQLRHASAHVQDAGRRMGLVCASASATPFRAEAFDVVFCDHGAMSFCDPAVTVPEVARLLRPGGLLAFSISTLLHNTCFPPGDPDAHGRHDAATTDVRRTRLRLGRRHDRLPDAALGVDRAVPSPRAASSRTSSSSDHRRDARTGYEGFADLDWARRWPGEEIWKVRKQ